LNVSLITLAASANSLPVWRRAPVPATSATTAHLACGARGASWRW
jgi:hypothetical protein